MPNTKLSSDEQLKCIKILQTRFEQNNYTLNKEDWDNIQAKLESKPNKLWSVVQMEHTNGEPAIFSYDSDTDTYFIYDCAKESPKGRRSLCYDKDGLDSRKDYKPKNNAIDLAQEMGIELLTEAQYRELQKFGNFDTKTSSWLKTPLEIRKLGGAIFGDFRYGGVFIYHNGAQSYYTSRGFRGVLKI